MNYQSSLQRCARVLLLVVLFIMNFAPTKAHAQTTARAEATVVNGFVVGVTVIDGGSGYPHAPKITLVGGGGQSAMAQATVVNGVVTVITVTATGSGYSNAPLVQIHAPPQIGLEVLAQIVLSAEPNKVYALQYTEDVTEQTGWKFLQMMAPTGEVSRYIDSESGGKPKRFYRLQLASPSNPDPSRLVAITPGTFTMGSPDGEVGRQSDEGPVTVVTLSSVFFMRRTEITQEEFSEVMGTNPSQFPQNPQNPVERVRQQDAREFCARLTQREQALGRLPDRFVYRLPTEAEWEYACRAGTSGPMSFPTDASYSNLQQYAWYGRPAEAPQPVGLKLPNALGLYDMHGNVWEWCEGLYTFSLPGGAVTDPKPDSGDGMSTVRGGSWWHGGFETRSANRFPWSGSERNGTVGFRPVLAKPLSE